jgi:threonine 3-dehydrogenase
LHPLDKSLRAKVTAYQAGDILDAQLMQRLVSQYEVTTIFHLAALLSTRAEFSPEIAHKVNVTGTLELLRLAHQQSTWSGQRTKFIFPSSIAAYGVGGKKDSLQPLKEHEYTEPTTMYGCNKVYCEHLGRYFAQYYQQLAAEPSKGGVDFRCIRFPGLISADTAPSGGTSDYGPEMIHAAAKGEPYRCFVRPDTTIPFMAMPDGVKALLDLFDAPESALSQRVYNINAFSCSAQDFYNEVQAHFPDAEISFDAHEKRQAIVDSWPAKVNDSPARNDWGFRPEFDLKSAFADYLVPRIKARYIP